MLNGIEEEDNERQKTSGEFKQFPTKTTIIANQSIFPWKLQAENGRTLVVPGQTAQVDSLVSSDGGYKMKQTWN